VCWVSPATDEVMVEYVLERLLYGWPYLQPAANTSSSKAEFTRKGVVITAITIVVAAPYLWLRYFVLA
jgi:hypothetical protein